MNISGLILEIWWRWRTLQESSMLLETCAGEHTSFQYCLGDPQTFDYGFN